MDVKYCLYSEAIGELLTEFKDQTILTTRHRAHSKTYINVLRTLYMVYALMCFVVVY